MIYETIVQLVVEGVLAQPFSVASIKEVSEILDRSPSFLSKHAMGNPGGYTEYFVRMGEGLYLLAW